MNIAVIGLGKLGLPMASLYACKENYVIGCDINSKLVKKVNDGECPYYETNLEEYLEKALYYNDAGKLIASTDIQASVETSEIIFVIVPTPSVRNSFTNEYIEKACIPIAQGLKQSKIDYPVVSIVSTVMVGSTEEVIKPLLEQESGLKCGKDFGLCYNPEFVALGSVIKNMLEPDAFLIGESDKKAGDKLVEFHESIVNNNPNYYRMSFYNAEAAKIMLNSFVVAKINLINCFANLCEKIPTGDIDVITEFLGEDRRIGHYYTSGGLRPGGPCFPRDNRAYREVAKKYNVISELQKQIIITSSELDASLTDKVYEILGENAENAIVSILGFTYKPNSDVIEESPILAIVDDLEVSKIRLYDPAGNYNAARQYREDRYVEIYDTWQECIKDSDLLILGTAWKEFEDIKSDDVKQLMRTSRVLDCWRFFDRDKFKNAGIEYHAIGVNSGN